MIQTRGLTKRWGTAALAVGSALVWGLAAGPRASAGDTVRQRVDWHGCQRGPQDEEGRGLDAAGAQCADIAVPLDYSRPGRRTITLAVSRLKATDSAHRVGALVINLGGPGIPARSTVPLAREAMGATGARFDLIGMDPRFVGRSTPIDCGWPSGWLPRSAGADRRGFDRMVDLARDLAKRCARRHGDVLPYASSATMARDLDAVRAALGEPKLSYLGYSYGSYLGALYTQLFPHRAGRIVLDSGIDPARPGTRKADNGPQREAALRDWAAWAAARDGQFHLGSTAAQVLSTVERVYAASARHPLRVGRYRVDDTVLPALLLDPLSDDGEESAAQLAATVRVLVRAAEAGGAEPTPDLDAALARLLTGANSAMASAQTAIMCADAAVPHDPERYWRDIQAHRAEAPLFGPIVRTITPCAFWPAGAVERPVRVRNDVPALVVSAAGDVNAILEQGQALHRALAGSRMITLDGARTHGVYLFRGAACVDDAVNAYLATGALPARDLTC